MSREASAEAGGGGRGGSGEGGRGGSGGGGRGGSGGGGGGAGGGEEPGPGLAYMPFVVMEVFYTTCILLNLMYIFD